MFQPVSKFAAGSRVTSQPRRQAMSARPAAEEVLGHLHHCLATLPRDGRDLLLAYYAGGDGTDKIEERQRLAHKWRLSPNALRSRVQRLRDRVDLCMRERCPVGEKGEDPGPRHVFPRPLT